LQAEEARRKRKKEKAERDLFHCPMRQKVGVCETCGKQFEDYEEVRTSWA